ncbi:MAG TPA: metallophosphoesterase [Actinomycetota bacterium]|nr:metallophosphoesterase [Actinomycetota bacterium]
MRRSIWCRVTALLLVCGAAASCASADTTAGDGCCAEGAAAAQTSSTVPSVVPSGSSVPEQPESFSFAVIGDFGTGEADQHDVAERMCSWREKHGFDLVFTTGDNVYPDGHPDRFRDAFYRPYECLTDDGVGFHAVLGNHDAQTDNGRPEIEDPAFGMPKRNYVVRTGGVRFVMIDSNSVNMDFLRRATRARANDDWTVVAMHHPVYSPGTGHGSEPGFRPKLPRLFRKRGVDLVLQGHDHIYAVTKPLRGIRYVVTGGGGAGLYGCTDQPYSAKCEARHHFLYVTATADELVVKAVPDQGKVFHKFSTDGI